MPQAQRVAGQADGETAVNLPSHPSLVPPAAALPGIYAGVMRLRVLFFGVLRDSFGPEQSLDLPDGSAVGVLVHHFQQAAPALSDFWRSVAVAVNQQYASQSIRLHDGDEVALLPPVSGGADMLSGYAF